MRVDEEQHPDALCQRVADRLHGRNLQVSANARVSYDATTSAHCPAGQCESGEAIRSTINESGPYAEGASTKEGSESTQPWGALTREQSSPVSGRATARRLLRGTRNDS